MNGLGGRNEAEVWQRVLAGRDPGAVAALGELYAEAQARAAEDGTLARRLSGPAGELARQLWEESREHVQILGGLMLMCGGEPGRIRAAEQRLRESVQTAIRRSYRRSCRMDREYTARIAEPEFGCVFSFLSEQEKRRCANLVRLLWLLRDSKGAF